MSDSLKEQLANYIKKLRSDAEKILHCHDGEFHYEWSDPEDISCVSADESEYDTLLVIANELEEILNKN